MTPITEDELATVKQSLNDQSDMWVGQIARLFLPALISEIEAKRGKSQIWESIYFMDAIGAVFYECACGSDALKRTFKFCPQCGREISWK